MSSSNLMGAITGWGRRGQTKVAGFPKGLSMSVAIVEISHVDLYFADLTTLPQ